MQDFLNKEIQALRNEIFANNKTISDLQVKNKKKQQKLSMLHELRAKYFREIKTIEIPNIQDKKIAEYISRIRRLKVDYFTLYKDLNLSVSRTADKYQLCQNNEYKFECRDIEEFIHYVEDYLKKQENAKSIELTKEPFSQEFYDRQNAIFKYEPIKIHHEAIEKIHDAQKQAIENIESKIIDFVRTKGKKKNAYYSIKETALIQWLNNNSLTMYDFNKALSKDFNTRPQSNHRGKFIVIREK